MKKIDDLLGELIQSAYACKRHHAFVQYSPHVELVEIRIFIGGWDDKKESEWHRVYLKDGNANFKLKALIDYIKYLGDNNVNI